MCKVAEGLNVDGILDSWSKIKPVIMKEWGEDKDALVDRSTVTQSWNYSFTNHSFAGEHNFYERVLKQVHLYSWNGK